MSQPEKLDNYSLTCSMQIAPDLLQANTLYMLVSSLLSVH